MHSNKPTPAKPAAGAKPKGRLAMLSERVILVDDSDSRRSGHPSERIVRKFPFRIGRGPRPPARHRSILAAWQERLLSDVTDSVVQGNDLYIDEKAPPFHVSRNHLEIGFDDGRLYFRDMGSALGTVVNGQRIGGERRARTIFSDRVENEVILGKSRSPWRFRVLLPQASRRRRLLIADDEEPVRNLLRRIFRDDFDIVEASNGTEALRLCYGDRPDIALLDWVMPGMEGVKVCKTLKSDVHTACMPVIMVTGLGSVTDRITGIEAGADDYVIKPVNVQELRASVAAVLSRSTRARDVHWLMGIASEAAFRDEVDALLSEDAGSNDEDYELLLLTLRGLGEYQNEHGPEATDHLQQEIARALLEQSMESERAVVGHLGLGRWGMMVRAEEAKAAEAELREELTRDCQGTPVRVLLKRRSAANCRNYHDLIGKL